MDTALYDILEVSKDATPEQMKRNYKKLCIQHHPDKGGDEQHFQKITEAYEILKDPEKRRIYDQFGMDGLKGSGGRPPDANVMHEMMNDLFGRGGSPFGSFFHSGSSQQKPQQHIMKSIKITLEDVVNGNPKFIYNHSRRVIKSRTSLVQCDLCKGRGSRSMTSNMAFMQVMQEVQCPQCRGNCYSNFEQCVEMMEEKIPLAIPPNCQESDRVVIKNKGDEHPVHPTGDLILQIEYENHPVFKRIQGTHHLYTIIEVSFYELLFGFFRSFKYLDGQDIHIHCTKNLSSNKCIPYIPCKGLYNSQSNSKHHLFLYVRLKPEESINTDENLSASKLVPYILEKNMNDTNNHPKKILTPLSYFSLSELQFFEASILSITKGAPSGRNGPKFPHGNVQQCSQQ